MIKIIAHDTTMKIPILNTLNIKNLNSLKTQKISLEKLITYNFQISVKKFPLINIINKLSNRDSLFETVFVTINDELVNLFLQKKISYPILIKTLLKLVSSNKFKKYKNIEPKQINDILNLNKYIKSQLLNHEYV